MTYFVWCTFDLKGASRQDYDIAYAELEKIGLKRVLVTYQGSNYVIPTTTVAGSLNGTSKESIRDYVCDQVQQSFKGRDLSSEIFVVVADDDTCWGGRTT